jgi:hypothetical protein
MYLFCPSMFAPAQEESKSSLILWCTRSTGDEYEYLNATHNHQKAPISESQQFDRKTAMAIGIAKISSTPAFNEEKIRLISTAVPC